MYTFNGEVEWGGVTPSPFFKSRPLSENLIWNTDNNYSTILPIMKSFDALNTYWFVIKNGLFFSLSAALKRIMAKYMYISTISV